MLYRHTPFFRMDGREKKLVHPMLFIVGATGLCLRSTNNPKTAFFRLWQSIETPCNYQVFFAIENNLNRHARRAFSAMYYFGSESILKAEVKTV